jgi:cold shock CspA family protein
MAKALPKRTSAKHGPKIISKVRPVLTGTKTRGRVTRILHGQGYGFIRTADDREVYFHRSDADGTFNDLSAGDGVVFELYEDRITGPRALRLRKYTKK